MLYISAMKRKTLLMLLIGFALSLTVGLANTNVNELNRPDEVVLVNDVIDITNQVAIETAFVLQKVDTMLVLGR